MGGAAQGAAAGSVAGPYGMAIGAVAGGLMGGFGSKKQKLSTQQKHFMEQQENQLVAQTELLNLRANLAKDIMAGKLPEAMKGYIDKVLIPQTTNTLTAAGLGRGGAVGEAVSTATTTAGFNLLGGLLTSSPAGGHFGEAPPTMPMGPNLLNQFGTAAELYGRIQRNQPQQPTRTSSPGAGGVSIPSSELYSF